MVGQVTCSEWWCVVGSEIEILSVDDCARGTW